MVFPMALGQATTPVLNSLGLEKRTFSNYVIGALLMLPCLFFLPKYMGVYSVAIAMGLSCTLTAILNAYTIFKKLGRGVGVKKAVSAVGYSIPLGILALFTNNLLDGYLGDWFSALITAFYVIFFFLICTSAFQVVDIEGYIKMFAPATSLSI